MNFREHYRSLSTEGRKLLADRLDSTTGYLAGIAWGNKKAGAVMCNNIERETNGVVTREELRPDIFKKETPTEAA